MKAMIRNLGFSVFFGALAILLCAPSQAPSQEVRATISGTITDPSGAPVPGAKVQITDVQRNMTYSTVSDTAGRYTSSPLLEGQYTVTVEAAGFRKYVRENILLHLTQVAGVNVTLEVGSTKQTVTVTSTAPLLDTQTANLGDVIPRSFIEIIPNNGRDVMNLVISMAGAYQPCTCTGQGATGGGHSTVEINGNAAGASGRATNNGIIVDGATDTDGSQGTNFDPLLYSVDELQVKTNTYDAEYGRTGGGYVDITTKSGTNQYHGIAYDNLENSGVDANTWDNNLNGEPRSSYIYHHYGFEEGGPIFIPKVLGRHKLFEMVSFEHTPEVGPSSQSATVPTAAERQGDFSSLLNSSGQPITIFDPESPQTVVNGNYQRTGAFPGNVIPADRINPIGQKIINEYPLPNATPTNASGINNLYSTELETEFDNEWVERVDYSPDDRNHFYGSADTYWDTIFDPGYFPQNVLITNGTSVPGENNGTHSAVGWTSILSPTTTFTLAGGFAREVSLRTNTVTLGFNPETLGFPASLVNQFKQLQYPGINMSKYSSQGANSVNTYGDNDTLDIRANMGKAVRKHFMKFGAEFTNYLMSSAAFCYPSGGYSFNGQWTQLNPLVASSTSGDAAADLLLGLPASGQVNNNVAPAYTSRDWGLYFQDDWQATRRLALNLGLRWDYDTPMEERHNRITRGFAFNTPSTIASEVTSAPGVDNCQACLEGLTGGLLFAGSSGSSRYAWNPDHRDFAPRFGAAYEVNKNTVLRGGFGMYYLLTAMNETPSESGFSSTTPLITSLNGGLTPDISLSNPLPNGLIPPTGSSQGLASFLGSGFSFQDLNFPAPRSYQASLGFERTLPGNIVVDASYVLNKTTGYPVDVSLNYLPVDQLYRPDSYYTQQVTNPFAGLLPANPAVNGATTSLENLLYAYPQFPSLGENNVPIGSARYDALEVSGTHRFTDGSDVMVNYTLSKSLGQYALLNAEDFNPLAPNSSPVDEELATFDVPQKLDMLGVYHLPFGHGERFANLPTPVNDVIGGWMLGFNVTLQSGYPIDYPNAGQIEPGSAALPADQQTRFEWFNTALFPKAPQAPFTLRTFPTVFPNVRFPAYNDWDFSAARDFPIHERLKLRFRCEWLNAFNQVLLDEMDSLSVTSPDFGVLKPSQENNPREIVFEADIIF